MKLTDLIEEQKRKFSAEQSDEDGFVSRYEHDILRHLVDSMTLAYEAGQKAERERIANEIVDVLPTGTVDAFAIIQTIQKYQKSLLTPPTTEDLSDKYEYYAPNNPTRCRV
jgi:hypothetical protein